MADLNSLPGLYREVEFDMLYKSTITMKKVFFNELIATCKNIVKIYGDYIPLLLHSFPWLDVKKLISRGEKESTSPGEKEPTSPDEKEPTSPDEKEPTSCGEKKPLSHDNPGFEDTGCSTA